MEPRISCFLGTRFSGAGLALAWATPRSNDDRYTFVFVGNSLQIVSMIDSARSPQPLHDWFVSAGRGLCSPFWVLALRQARL